MNRFKELRLSKDLSQQKIANMLSISQAAYSKYECDKAEPDIESLKILSKFYDVSIDYLLERTDKKGIDAFDEKHPAEDILYLPVYATVAAGFNKSIVDKDYDGEMQEIPASIIRGHKKEDLFVFEVSGDSMFPKFLEGDRVLVVRQTSVDSGDIAIVCYNGFEEGTIKKVQYEPNCDYVDLIPSNPKYMPIRLQGDDLETCRVVGKVIYLFRKI